MVKIGIVDDEKEAREQLKGEVARFGAEYHMEFEVREFDSAAAYLSAAADGCDILYLDVDMPQMTGMELAEKIRETDTDIILIFCTNLQQFALNGYGVSALGFLVKPVQWYSFHMYLDRAVKTLRERALRAMEQGPGRIIVKSGADSVVVNAAEIQYVEVEAHYLIYHIKSRESGEETALRTRGSMQDAAAQLTPWGFARCNASFLVNLSRITLVNRMELHLGQTTLPIGRAYKDSFTREFSKYLARKGWEGR